MSPDNDTCRPVGVDGGIVRVHGGSEMNAADLDAFADIVRAAKRRYASERTDEPV